MNRRRNKTRSNMLRKAFQGRRPNTTRMYASRLEKLAKRLGMDDIPGENHDILSPWWLADPDRVVRVLQRGGVFDEQDQVLPDGRDRAAELRVVDRPPRG